MTSRHYSRLPFSPSMSVISANLLPLDLRHSPEAQVSSSSTSLLHLAFSPSTPFSPSRPIFYSYNLPLYLDGSHFTMPSSSSSHDPDPSHAPIEVPPFFCTSDEAQVAFDRGELRFPEHIYDKLDAYLGLYGNQEALTLPVPEPFLT